MKCNIPKDKRPPRIFQSLTQSQKEEITKWINETVTEETNKAVNEETNKAVNEEEAELQIVWLKMNCEILHRVFNADESTLLRYLVEWKRMYQRNARFKSKEEQTEYLNGKMAEIFTENGFPADYIETMKVIK